MGLLIAGCVLTAWLLLSQAVHIIRHGNMRPFFLEPNDLLDSQTVLRPTARYLTALLYTVPSVAILGGLTLALLQSDKRRLLEWLADRGLELAGAVFVLVYGLIAVLRPGIVVRWVASMYQQQDFLARSTSVRTITRALGVLLFWFGLLILKNLH